MSFLCDISAVTASAVVADVATIVAVDKPVNQSRAKEPAAPAICNIPSQNRSGETWVVDETPISRSLVCKCETQVRARRINHPHSAFRELG